MKMPRFLFILSVLTACSHPPKKEEPKPARDFVVVIHPDRFTDKGARIVSMMMDADTGYFQVGEKEAVTHLDEHHLDSCTWLNFLEKNLHWSSIQLQNDSGLLHTIRISGDSSLVYDTLTGNGFQLIQSFNQKTHKQLSFSINGHACVLPTEDLVGFWGEGFRVFSFHGQSFYYLPGNIWDSYGGSASLIRYNMLIPADKPSPELFTDFRTHGHIQFGDLDGDANLDYLDLENDGGQGINPKNLFRISLYSFDPVRKRFEPRRDAKGRFYFIAGNTEGDYYVGEHFQIDSLYWPVRVEK